MGRTNLHVALAVLLMAGAVAPSAAQSCNPDEVDVTPFLDLADPVGQIACKAGPKVNISAAVKKLTGTARSLTSTQLDGLPGLINTILPVSPGTIQPILGIGASQLEKLLPVLTQVPPNVLAGILKQLAGTPDSTLNNMLQLLRSVGLSRLQQLKPIFEEITPQQVELLLKALRTLPNYAIDFIIQATRKLGGLGGLGGSGGSSSGGSRVPTVFPPDTKAAADSFYAAAAAKAASSKPCPEDQALAAGSDILLDQTGDIGNLICQFGSEPLLRVLTATLGALAKEHPDTLANLPAYADILAGLDSKTSELFFRIPLPTLRELVPLLSQLQSGKVQVALQTIAGESSSTIDALVWFVKNVSFTQLNLVLPLFSKIDSCQVANMAKLLNNLNPDQMLGSLGLLDGFRFQLGPIGIRVNLQLSWFDAPDHNKCGGSSYDAGEATVSRYTGGARVGPFSFGTDKRGSGIGGGGGGIKIGPVSIGGGGSSGGGSSSWSSSPSESPSTSTYTRSSKSLGPIRIGGGSSSGFVRRFGFGR